ncbi:MAG: type II secretion system F family protein [Defluviicoccus sp.]|nr:type II secretion system F family protein [Defluviicoccus sp.]MDE0382479.1 type II secretion system F family protein [Defluviicoccus sp.]
MSVLAFSLTAGGAVALLNVFVYLLLRSRDRKFRRRLDFAAAPVNGSAGVEHVQVDAQVFRPSQGRSRITRFWRAVESRYPLLDTRRSLPSACGLGLAAAAGLWFSMWFLKVPSGWWTIPVVSLGGVFATFYAMSWFHARRAAEFTRQFPEIIDQVVRLSGAGVPALEAIAVVAEDARPPVQPVLRAVGDALVAGLDADTALRSVSARVRLSDFTLFAAVISLQRRSGGGVSTAFSNLSRALRDRRGVALKARSSTAQTRITLVILSLMPVLVLLAQNFISPQSVAILFGTAQGNSLLHWGVGMIVAGLVLARTIAARVEQ